MSHWETFGQIACAVRRPAHSAVDVATNQSQAGTLAPPTTARTTPIKLFKAGWYILREYGRIARVRIGVRGLEGTTDWRSSEQGTLAPSRTVAGKGLRGVKLRPGHDAVAFSCGRFRKRRELPNEPNSVHAGLCFVKNEAKNEPKLRPQIRRGRVCDLGTAWSRLEDSAPSDSAWGGRKVLRAGAVLQKTLFWKNKPTDFVANCARNEYGTSDLQFYLFYKRLTN